MSVIVTVVVGGVIVPMVVVHGRAQPALPHAVARPRSQRRRRSRIAKTPMPTTITPEARLSHG